MDQFDFDDIDDQTVKKPATKLPQKQSSAKGTKNTKNDEFFDFEVSQKPKAVQSKKNNFQYNNIDSYLDDMDKKQPNKKNSQKNKQNQSTLPRLNVGKSPQQNQKKLIKNKMDLSLQELPEKRVMVQKQQKRVKKQSQQFDYAVYGNESNDASPKRQLKTNIVPLKQKPQQKKPIETKSSPKSISKTVQVVPLKAKQPQKAKVQKKKSQISEDDYGEDYEQEIEQVDQKPQVSKKEAQKKNIQSSLNKQQQTKISPQQLKQQPIKNDPSKQSSKSVQKQPKPQTRSKQQQPKQLPITKYKQMVQKSFPEEQDEQKIKKLKPDALNRLNDKMRQMIKGFSAELTELIDKNLLLLRKPQNEIKEEIQGEPIDPVQAQIKVMQQSRKNNQKMLQISQKQLQTTTKMNERASQSVSTNVQVTQDIEAFKKHIGIISRQINGLKNDIQKQGNKVVKLEEGNKKSSTDQNGGRFKSSVEISEKLANTKLEFQKNKKKLQQLNEKQKSLEQKINEISAKRSQVLQKASAEGISFCSKQEKKRYEQLKKKHQQMTLFESKFKSSIKSKQSVIQHQMTDLQVLIEDYQKRHQLLNQQADSSKQRIFAQIARAKKNPKLNRNTKQILAQLESFMADDHSSQTDDQFNSLNYISQNIYKKEYQPKNTNSKSLTEQKEQKKVAYKNYLQQVAKINQQNKAKFTSQRRNSQVNPFRKAVTPNQTSQSKQSHQKMNRTKENKIQADKQKQRVWKSSNTQTLIRNPLKKQVSKSRYQNPTQEQNPLNNKEIMKLINKNKEQITLKQEEKLKTQQAGTSKKPFTFRASLKQKQLNQNINALADIPKQMEKIQKTLQNKRNQIQKQSHNDERIGVKLKDKELQGLSLTMELKPPVNSTPFRNIKLKKDKDKEAQGIQSQSKFKLQPEQPISEKIIQKKQPIKQNSPAPIQQETSFKPKRFNLRQKKQNTEGGYMPSVQAEKQKQMIPQKPKEKEPQPQIKIQQNKFRISDPTQSKIPQKKVQEQMFDPFKKFMANPTKQDKLSTKVPQTKHEPIKLNQNPQPPAINIKPRMNLFKKSANQTEQVQKKFVVLKDTKKEQPALIQEPKFINPYAKQQPPKQEPIKIQRQGKVKKNNPLANNAKGGNKNIFGDVEDATANNNILSLGEPQPIHNKLQQSYVPKSINQQKQLNVNDLLGIKKKNFQVDKDLLIDLPNNNKVGVKVKANGKANDFFGDMDL